MRILAVSQIADLLQRHVEAIAAPSQPAVLRGVRHRPNSVPLERVAMQVDGGERRADGGVVGPGMGERLAHQPVAEREARRPVERLEQRRIIGRVDDDEHAAEVLRRGAHQRRSADVDLLDERVEGRRRIRRRLDERVEVDDHDVHQAQAVALEGREVVRAIAPREDPAVQGRVQRLDAPVHHLGKAGHGPTRWSPPGRRRSSARAVPPVETSSNPRDGEAAADIHDAGLVGNA